MGSRPSGPVREILVGTSGWSYDDWVGPFYPKALDRKSWIGFYAERFPTVEVNFTHYHLPSAKDLSPIVHRMAKAKLASAVFKAPRVITHEALIDGHLDEAGRLAQRFHEALQPAAGNGLLSGLLYQFSHQADPRTIQPGIEAILREDPPAPLFVEVRHAAYNEDRYLDELRALVEPTGGAVAATDSPATTIVRAPPAEQAYFRFHGRNEQTWFEKDPPGIHGSARYDYTYRDDELRALAERVEAAGSARTFVYFNNHPRGQAAQDAMRFMELMDLASPGKRVTLDDF